MTEVQIFCLGGIESIDVNEQAKSCVKEMKDGSLNERTIKGRKGRMVC